MLRMYAIESRVADSLYSSCKKKDKRHKVALPFCTWKIIFASDGTDSNAESLIRTRQPYAGDLSANPSTYRPEPRISNTTLNRHRSGFCEFRA